jgi:hypothetical protein
LLSAYRETLIEHTNDPSLLKVYFLLSAKTSLQNLVIANLEFNQGMPISNIYQLNQQEQFLPYEILLRMPLYLQKLNQAAKERHIQHLFDENSMAPTQEMTPITKQRDHYQLLHEDSDNILKLMHDINLFLTNILPTISSNKRYKVLAGLIVATSIIATMALLAYFITSYINDDNMYKKNPYPYYREQRTTDIVSLALLVPLVSALSFVISLLSTSILCRKQTSISSQHWQTHLKYLKEMVLDKLHHLESIQQNTNQYDLLPIDHADIAAIDNIYYALQNNHKQQQVQQLFNNLNQLLDQLQRAMLYKQRPLSFFYTPKIEEVTVTMPLENITLMPD